MEMDPRERLERLRDAARSATRNRFVDSHRGWYFVGRVDLGIPTGRLAFETESFDLQDIPKLLRRAIESGELPKVSMALGPGMGEIHTVRKTDPDAWASRITVGRATNNDVVLRHKSVSKVHANVRFRNGTAEDDPPTLIVMDVGSRNGTWVNKRRLEIDRFVTVVDGDLLNFGSHQVVALTAMGLYEGLRAWR